MRARDKKPRFVWDIADDGPGSEMLVHSLAEGVGMSTPDERPSRPARRGRQCAMLSFGFPPISSPSARVLILGSLGATATASFGVVLGPNCKKGFDDRRGVPGKCGNDPNYCRPTTGRNGNGFRANHAPRAILWLTRPLILIGHREAHRETRYRATAEPSDPGIAI